MNVKTVQLKVTHQYLFRYGEWADVVGVVMVTPQTGQPRLCYHLRYTDGVCDYVPTSETNIEIRAAS